MAPRSGWSFIGQATSDPRQRLLALDSPAKAATSSPSRRATRQGGSNLVHYARAVYKEDEDDQEDECLQVAIGDVVLVSDRAQLALPELDGHRAASALAGKRSAPSPSPKKRRSPKKGRKVEEEDARIALLDDGLGTSRVGVIVDLFEDERERPQARMHWLVRPAVLAQTWHKGDLERLDLEEPLAPFELLYSSDRPFFADADASHADRDTKAEDIVALEFIDGKVTIVEDAAVVVAHGEERTYLVRRAWDRAPPADLLEEDGGEAWMPSINFNELVSKGMATGQWELFSREIRKRSRKDKHGRADGQPPAKRVKVEDGEDSESSDDSGEDDLDLGEEHSDPETDAESELGMQRSRRKTDTTASSDDEDYDARPARQRKLGPAALKRQDARAQRRKARNKERAEQCIIGKR